MKTAVTTKKFRFLTEGNLVTVPKGTFVTWEWANVGPEVCISLSFDGVAGVHQWAAEFEEGLLDHMGILPMARVPVLCGCGWGFLTMPENEVPECCPMCGHSLAQCLN